MMGYLNGSSTLSSTINVPPSISAAQVLAALHDHSLMIALNPLVISYNRISLAPADSTSKSRYSIRDRIAYLPFHLWDTEITYVASFEDTPTGVRTVTNAPAGLEICAEWKVLPMPKDKDEADRNGEEGSVVEETASFTCNVLLMPYIRHTMSRSHEELKRKFISRLEHYKTGQ